MSSRDLKNFKISADELINDALRISGIKDSVEGIPQSQHYIQKLRHHMVTAFVSVTRAMFLIFNLKEKKTSNQFTESD